jgi:hypothetical protein
MNEEVIEYYQRMTRATLLMQSVLHQLDEVSDSSLHKFRIKQITNLFIKEAEKIVNVYANNLEEETAKSYVEIVQNVDNLINTLQVKIEN